MKSSSNLLLWTIIIMSFFTLSCGGGGGGGGDGDQVTSEVTFSDFVGTWSGQFTAASSSETLSGNTVLMVNSGGTGSMHFNFNNGNSETHSVSSFQVVGDILYFDLPNSDPGDPDCANWDVEVTLSITGSLGGGGNVCSSTGGMSITFSGSLAFTPSDSTADIGNCNDIDNDGYYAESGCGASTDCNDNDEDIHPGAIETCNGKDDDCDGNIDEGGVCQTCTDFDNDGYYADQGCGSSIDCNDANDTIYPGAAELCDDNTDNDCDGDTDCGDADCSDDYRCAHYVNSLGMTFNLILPGTYTMGSPEVESGHSGDEIQHQVTLTQPFYLQTTEVTQGQWEAVMGNNPSYFTDCGNDCPVEQVSWEDAQDFIAALNDLGEGTYRLPTEAEWEYAARAGSTTAFANGDFSLNNLDAMGWYDGNSGDTTHTVAQKQPNAWGLYDMHGNVLEWCQDRYGNYPSGSVTDPQGPSSGSARVVRGGCWGSHAEYCSSANRGRLMPGGNGGSNSGLRLVGKP
jgi:formylglycine-generating enzyme required for sulfatase activity